MFSPVSQHCVNPQGHKSAKCNILAVSHDRYMIPQAYIDPQRWKRFRKAWACGIQVYFGKEDILGVLCGNVKPNSCISGKIPIQNLWSNLETLIPPSDFHYAHIIFLGDYCDRGSHTREVLDFLIALPSKYPNQSHVFLAGNHDFAFAAFLGAIPPSPDGSEFSDTWEEFKPSEQREGWYKGYGYEKMHLQGRRWGGTMAINYYNTAKGTDYKDSQYSARATFESYGVPHASPDLMKAVPDEHRKFLADLAWILEEDNVFIETDKGLQSCKLIAVHGGLEKGKDVKEQINYLKEKDTRISRLKPLSGRKSVWDIPEELRKSPTIVVSGHHGKLHVDGLRLIIDEGGGKEQNPVAAIVLPSKTIVRDTDKLEKS